jgi:signal peptidase
MSDDAGPKGVREWLRWLRTTDRPGVVYAREVTTSVAAVLAVGLLLFAVSGVWPPMVAVESGSMEPNMQIGDLVFVMEEDRLSPAFAHESGVVSHRVGEREGYTKFSEPGDVIIYRANNGTGTPIIHRARFWVDEGENWYDEADPDYIGGADDCESLPNCPAPTAGFITKGDNAVSNGRYDQVNGLSAPVKPDWIVGTAEARIPFLGYVKLCASGAVRCPVFTTAPAPVGPAEMTLASGTVGDRAVAPTLATEDTTVGPSAGVDNRTAAAGSRVSRPVSG